MWFGGLWHSFCAGIGVVARRGRVFGEGKDLLSKEVDKKPLKVELSVRSSRF